MISDERLKAARYISLVASTAIALACGTNYVFSAYGPQLQERLKLSTTETNWIGTMGNIGMYLSGIPAGMLVDRKGPKLAILLGSICLFVGYYPIHLAYVWGEGSMSVFALCFFALITGCGSCTSFNGALKAAALNWPANRGAATAFPLAAFGLSAFFFSTLSSYLFPGDTSSFLLVLAVATSALVFVSFFFLRVIPSPTPGYSVIPSDSSSTRLHRTKSGESSTRSYVEPGTQASSSRTAISSISSLPVQHRYGVHVVNVNNVDGATETTSILSKSSSSSETGRGDSFVDHTHHIDIRGWALTTKMEFWLQWLMLGLMTGVGLMTINNIGITTKALWTAYDPERPADYVQRQQSMHVSIISLLSFTGRIISGTVSDHIKRNHGFQRIWLLFSAATLFIIAQMFALNVENPYNMWLVSTTSGLAYGLLFGVFPTIVSESFGIHGMSQNWGTMTVACVVSGQTFNYFFGRIFDAHTITAPDGARTCPLGLQCYQKSYYITLAAAVVSLGLSGVAILRNQREEKAREEGEGRGEA